MERFTALLEQNVWLYNYFEIISDEETAQKFGVLTSQLSSLQVTQTELDRTLADEECPKISWEDKTDQMRLAAARYVMRKALNAHDFQVVQEQARQIFPVESSFVVTYAFSYLLEHPTDLVEISDILDKCENNTKQLSYISTPVVRQ